jgi:hypothetical protein
LARHTSCAARSSRLPRRASAGTGSADARGSRLVAEKIKARVKAIHPEGALRYDLDASGAAAEGSGFIYICDPNTTAMVLSAKAVTVFAEFIVASSRNESAKTTILTDQAY